MRNALTRNYMAIADGTQRPFSTPKSTRSQRSWAWNPKARKPSKCVRINPQTYDKEQANA